MRPTGETKTCYLPLYVHKCGGCGKMGSSLSQFPYIHHEEVSPADSHPMELE